MLPMTTPATSARVLLVADNRRPSSVQGSTAVRRYRLARLRLDGRSADPVSRFEHIKRAFD